MTRWTRVAAFAAALCAAPALAADDTNAELMLRWDQRSANVRGPLAAAEALSPGIAPATPSAALLQAEARHTLRAAPGVSLQANVLLAQEWPRGQARHDRSRVNEGHVGVDLGDWQLGAGKKVLGWDVGYGFRPNDVVQQEERRTQLGQAPEGRPLLQLEHFSAETAWTLVWANPQRWNDAADAQRGARESALAARWYGRLGTLDLHGFARHGRHTGTSVGAALAWVTGDSLELHASARVLQRRDGWQIDGAAADSLLRSSPWHQATLGGTGQWLLGGQWTSASQHSLLLEWWHDGTALPDAGWERWRERNAALAATAGRAGGRIPAAANLAWQADAFAAASLRRDNLFVRLAWQPEHWLWTLDALATPADRGRIVTAALQWQGDRVRLNASWRLYGGPRSAVLAQLPLRHSALLAASVAF